MSPVKIRSADPERDAAACAAIYAPHVEASATSFEAEPPTAAELAERIERTGATHPWLVAESDGEVVGFAYACEHRTRAAYRWAVDVSIYLAEANRGQGLGRALYEELFERLREQRFRVACAGVTLPNEASVAAPREPRIRPGRRLPPDRVEGRRLARRRLVAARSQPRREDPPGEPLAPGYH